MTAVTGELNWAETLADISHRNSFSNTKKQSKFKHISQDTNSNKVIA